ncbi:MAG: hypothetical protein ACT7A5_24910 [Ferrovibrionaceae bacterium]
MKPLRCVVLAAIAAVAAVLATGLAAPAEAGGRVAVGVSIGTGWYGPGYYPRYYGPRYYGYSAYYYPPPAVVVAPPPPPPPPVVVYQQPAPNYYVAPQRPAVAQQQPYCREYQKTVIIGGQPQPGFGTACMQPDGSWKAIN